MQPKVQFLGGEAEYLEQTDSIRLVDAVGISRSRGGVDSMFA